MAFYAVDSDWAPFGAEIADGGGFWDSMSGDNVALFNSSDLGLPGSCDSFTPLSGSAIAFGESFASAGLTVGSYVTTLTNGGVSDTVAVNVVPETGTAILMGLGLLGLLGLAARRRRS